MESAESIALSDFDVPHKYLPLRVVVDDGVSAVVEATNRGTKRVVFLRFWRKREQSADWNRHLARLVRAVVAAGSEHLFQILDMEVGGRDDAGFVLVLESVKGRSLAEVIEEDGPLALGRACRMAIGLAQAIDDCHQWGIIPAEPTVDRVFLTQYAGQRDFVKLLAPNVVGITDPDAKVRDTVGWVRILWAALTGKPGPVPPNEETVTNRLREVTGADEQELEVLARLVVDGALGEEDVGELASRLQAAGLADPPSVHPSVSFETRLPQAEPRVEDPGTMIDDVEFDWQDESEGGRIRPWHLALASFFGFLLGALSAAGLFWSVKAKRQDTTAGAPRTTAQDSTDAGVGEDARDMSYEADVSDVPALKFAVAYYSPSPMVNREMRSLTRYLTRALGRRVRFVGLSHGQAAKMLDEGHIHIAVFSPYMYVLNRARYRHFKLLVSHLSDGNLTYQGFLVVRSDSPITSLADSKGKRICFVSPESTSGYLFPLALFKRHGLDPRRDFKLVRFSGTHEGVIADLQERRCDIGAVSSPAYLNAARSSALRMVAVTDRIPGDAYCVTSHLDKALIEKIRLAFIGFNPRRYMHRPYLGKLHRITGFQEVDDAHYDPIRRVHRALFGSEITAKTAIRPLAPR